MSKISSNIINKFSLMCFFLYILFSILFRFLLPFGDEPDFTVRAPRFVLGESELIPSFIYFISSRFDYISHCRIESELYSYLSSIDYNSCVQDIYQISMRLFLQWLLIFIPFFLFCYRLPLYSIFNNEPRWQIDKKLDALSITFVCSSFIYYYGVIGWEQLILLFSCFVFLFFDKKILLIPLIVWVVFLDVGDSIVILYSTTLFFVFRYIAFKFGFKVLYVCVFLLLFVSYIFSTSLITLLSFVDIFSEKAIAISSAYESSDLHSKYPIFLRPVITFMTLVLYLPSGIKSIGGIFLSFLLFTYVVVRHQKEIKYFEDCKIYMVVIVSVVFSVIFILPGYANGKYYIFMMPMFFYYVLSVCKKRDVLFFISIVNCVCLLELTLFYLSY